MVFAAVRTHFPKKSTRVYRNTVTCVTRVTSNRVEVHRLNSQHLAMVRTSKMAELVPSTLQPWFLQRSEHISPRKTPVFMSIQLQSINSCLSIKINSLFAKLAEVVQRLAFRQFGISVVRPPWGTKLFCPSFFLITLKKQITSSN